MIFRKLLLTHPSMGYPIGSKITFAARRNTHSVLKPKSPVAARRAEAREKQTMLGGYKIATFSLTWVTGPRAAGRALAFRSARSEIRSDFVNLGEKGRGVSAGPLLPRATTKVSKQEKTWEDGPASTHASSALPTHAT
jgi:hypothetical protein